MTEVRDGLVQIHTKLCGLDERMNALERRETGLSTSSAIVTGRIGGLEARMMTVEEQVVVVATMAAHPPPVAEIPPPADEATPPNSLEIQTPEVTLALAEREQQQLELSDDYPDEAGDMEVDVYEY
jgi:hypothetical protein